MADNKKEKLILCENMNYVAREAFIRLRTNIQFSFVADDICKVIGVTSSRIAEGKSTTSINLAYSLAQLEEQKVLLIDCDMRRPSLHDKLNLQRTPGLSNLLTNVHVDGGSISQYVPVDKSQSFDVIAAGDIPPNPSELLNSERMGSLLTTLRKNYNYIILDLPPLGAVADAQTVSKRTDGMIVVIKEGSCPKEMLEESLEQLRLAKCHILGFVLNGVSEDTGKKYKGYKYSKYYNKNYKYYNQYYSRQ